MKITISVSMCLMTLMSLAQESNYTTVLQGGRASLMSGAVVGGLFDNTAFFYNPGAVAYLDQATFSINTSSVGWNLYAGRNAFGTDLNFRQTQSQYVPYMLAGTVPIKINQVPDLVLGYSFFTKASIDQSFEVRHESIQDVNPYLDGEEYYYTSYSNYKSITDKWLGLTASYKLNEKWGIGLTSFITFMSYDKSLTMQSNVVSQMGQVDGYASSYLSSNRLDFYENGVVFKLGVAYHEDANKFGLSVTFPQIDVNVSNSSISQDVRIENVPITLPDGSVDLIGTVIDQNAFETTDLEMRTPFTVALGYAWQPRKNRFYGVTVEYMNKIDPYTVISAPEGDAWSISSNVIFQQSRLFYQLEHTSIINASIGITEEIKKGLQLIVGVRTNRSFLPADKIGLSLNGNIPAHNSSTDLYHLSFGFNGHSKQVGMNLTAGLDLAFGYVPNATELLNWSDPIMYNLESKVPLTGVRQNEATYMNSRLMIIIGAQFDL